jgi:hypothetical protein
MSVKQVSGFAQIFSFAATYSVIYAVIAQQFLQEQEVLQARKREKEAAAAKARHSQTGPDSFHTQMEIDKSASQQSQPLLRAKKSAAQRELQDAFRT